MTDALDAARRVLNGRLDKHIGGLFGQAQYITNAVEALIDAKVNAILDAREEKTEPADTVSHMWSEVDKARLAERDARIAELERERDDLKADAKRIHDEKMDHYMRAEKAEAALAELQNRVEKAATLLEGCHYRKAESIVEALALLSPEGEAKDEPSCRHQQNGGTEAVSHASHAAQPAYYPAVIEYPEAGRVEFVLRDGFNVYDKGDDYDIIRDGETREVIGFAWPQGTNPATKPVRTIAQPARDSDPVPAPVLIIRETSRSGRQRRAYRPAREGETPAFIDLEFGPMVRRKARSIARRPAGLKGGSGDV